MLPARLLDMKSLIELEPSRRYRSIVLDGLFGRAGALVSIGTKPTLAVMNELRAY